MALRALAPVSMGRQQGWGARRRTRSSRHPTVPDDGRGQGSLTLIHSIRLSGDIGVVVVSRAGSAVGGVIQLPSFQPNGGQPTPIPRCVTAQRTLGGILVTSFTNKMSCQFLPLPCGFLAPCCLALLLEHVHHCSCHCLCLCRVYLDNALVKVTGGVIAYGGGSSHCSSRYQNQLILTTCHVRYHIALWDNRDIGQL